MLSHTLTLVRSARGAIALGMISDAIPPEIPHELFTVSLHRSFILMRWRQVNGCLLVHVLRYIITVECHPGFIMSLSARAVGVRYSACLYLFMCGLFCEGNAGMSDRNGKSVSLYEVALRFRSLPRATGRFRSCVSPLSRCACRERQVVSG